MMTIIWIIIGLAVALVFGNILTYTFQYHILFRPRKMSDDHPFHFQVHFEEINLITPGNGKINCLWFKANNEKSKKGVILYFHGNVGNLLRWGHIYDQEFHKLGLDLIMMDYRGYGKSKGRINEKFFFKDAEAVFMFAKQHYSSQEIIIYGRSIGSGLASYLASEVYARKLILETPFSSISDLFHSYYPFLPKLFVFRFPFKNKEYLKSVPYPIIVIVGANDKITPVRSSRELKKSLKKDDKYVIIKDGKHNNLSSFSEFYELIKKELS
ncbi:alpha/beta hydrolase [Solitalea lacus]|uniref:alpha/beta hydrolase n=1 Tax=Solitalea lacus TaxID=2911172 RepID=UPI001EDA3A9B|nr:alpha/beta hydrolase [Solitalea lacus]UKJ06675.1 alpha/beta hydrolase [Solitalea lacus]